MKERKLWGLRGNPSPGAHRRPGGSGPPITAHPGGAAPRLPTRRARSSRSGAPRGGGRLQRGEFLLRGQRKYLLWCVLGRGDPREGLQGTTGGSPSIPERGRPSLLFFLLLLLLLLPSAGPEPEQPRGRGSGAGRAVPCRAVPCRSTSEAWWPGRAVPCRWPSCGTSAAWRLSPCSGSWPSFADIRSPCWGTSRDTSRLWGAAPGGCTAGPPACRSCCGDGQVRGAAHGGVRAPPLVGWAPCHLRIRDGTCSGTERCAGVTSGQLSGSAAFCPAVISPQRRAAPRLTAEVRSAPPLPGAVPLQPRRESGDAGLSRSSPPSLRPLQQLPRRFGTAEVTARGRSVLPAPASGRGLFLPEPLSFPFSSLSSLAPASAQGQKQAACFGGA